MNDDKQAVLAAALERDAVAPGPGQQPGPALKPEPVSELAPEPGPGPKPESAQPVAGDQTPSAPDVGVDDKMARLRQLLFGSQLRDFDHRLREIAERRSLELERLRDEQRARFDKLDSFVRGELERLTGSLRHQRDERVAATRDLEQSIQALARELTGDLGRRIDRLEAALAAEATSREAALLALSAEHRDALESRIDALERQLRDQQDRLQDVKISRDELAQLFSEVALRLNRELDLPRL